QPTGVSSLLEEPSRRQKKHRGPCLTYGNGEGREEGFYFHYASGNDQTQVKLIIQRVPPGLSYRQKTGKRKHNSHKEEKERERERERERGRGIARQKREW